MAVLFGQAKSRNQDRIVEILERRIFEMLLQNSTRFLMIHCEQPLIEAGIGRQRRLVPEEDVKEPELWNVSTDDQQANRERSGENETNRTPNRGPENRRYQNRKR